MALRILVVDRDSDTRSSVTAALGALHHEVRVATSCAQALAAIRAPRAPDLVLLEPALWQGGSGWEVLAALDACPLLARLAVLVITELPDVSAPHGRPVLHKPFTGAQLLEAVEAMTFDGRGPSCRRAPRSHRLDPR